MSQPFSRTALIAITAVALISLAIAVALTVIGDDAGRPSAGVDGYSVSAIGHRGLVELLEKLDVPVIVSRSDSAVRARKGLLIVAEPTVTDAESRARLAALIAGATRVLVVLPKWHGSVERGKVWLSDADLLPLDEVTPVLDAMSLEHPAQVSRAMAPIDWQVVRDPTLPAIREPQVVISPDLQPIVADRTGNLLVSEIQRDAAELYVLSDPDVLNNFGLRDGENARFTVGLIDWLRVGGPVVLDETMHGYARQPSLARTLFRFPLVLATLQVVMCGVLVVWAAMVQFGPRRAAPPPIAPGKDFLIRNTAALLHYGGHHGDALRRYLQHTVAAVRHRLHAPALAPAAMTAWLDKLRLARGGTISLAELEQAAEAANNPARVIELADRVFHWRMEMTHGAHRRS